MFIFFEERPCNPLDITWEKRSGQNRRRFHVLLNLKGYNVAEGRSLNCLDFTFDLNQFH